ncbi:Uncharacterised protein [Arcanobacterium haemolyticum]|nr:Uncharacterised protein [Arcanobacterium haemolyticum]
MRMQLSDMHLVHAQTVHRAHAIGGAIVDCGNELIDAIATQLANHTPTPPRVYATPAGMRSVEESAKMFALNHAHERVLGLLASSRFDACSSSCS